MGARVRFAVGLVVYAYAAYVALDVLSLLLYPAVPDGEISDGFLGFWLGCWGPWVVNGLLLLVFVAQHSGMATHSFKKRYCASFPGEMYRVLYTGCSCAALQVVVYFWEPQKKVWGLEEGSRLASIVTLFRILGFVSISCSLLYIDLYELVGLKQIYNHNHNWDAPKDFYSPSLQRLYRHCRHPVFWGPIMVMLGVPVVTQDRLFLVGCFVFYMAYGTNLDRADVNYVGSHLASKSNEAVQSSPTRRHPGTRIS